MNKIVDYKNREFTTGERVCIQENIPSVNGMLYKNSIVKVDEIDYKNQKIRVTDSTGKVWWVESQHVSASFL